MLKNSSQNCKWAMKNITDWLENYNLWNPDKPCPSDVLSPSCTKDFICIALRHPCLTYTQVFYRLLHHFSYPPILLMDNFPCIFRINLNLCIGLVQELIIWESHNSNLYQFSFCIFCHYYQVDLCILLVVDSVKVLN